MLTVNKFMCQVELFVGCIIIGLLNAVFSVIFFVYSIMDIYYHNLDREERKRSKRAPLYSGIRDRTVDRECGQLILGEFCGLI
jgi:hypothetical protein